MGARLRRVRPEALEWRWQRHGRGRRLTDGTGLAIRDSETLERVRALGVPPAWTDVRVAPDPRGHIQALGTDAAGRRQYIYHRDWEARRVRRKQGQLRLMADALPRLRRRLRADLEAEPGSKALALAIAVTLIDGTAMRIGRERYLETSGTRGAGTLFVRDVVVSGDEVCLNFPAKSGKAARYCIRDGRLARAIEAVRSVPGKRLLMYRDADGKGRNLRTEEINRYLRDVTGLAITAKDFRTFHASARAGEALAALERAESEAARKRQVAGVVRQVAAFLQNTPAVCRTSYVAPCLIALFEKGRLGALWAAVSEDGRGLRRREARLCAVLAAVP
jgi:DNA topoisomerase I